ncbi:MAG: bifunctional hydroxymethylpyrimidine kinase/phosphomethylpyrimidine kinase [Desulfurivibrio sp.]|nr:bifunctional hydroxymethylpyrimidine kinase/phosphomethylpyrimidine kinase [Desulfurivibrio sp.]
MTTEAPTALLSIAGSDPAGGAGIQADLKTCTALGVYGAAAITCVTVQNSQGVRYFEPLEQQLVYDQIRAVLVDLPISHIKIGMLGSAGVADAVADALYDFTGVLVYDPVLNAGDGHTLFPAAALQRLADDLLSKITVITPNLPELATLDRLPQPPKQLPPLPAGIPADSPLTAAGRLLLRFSQLQAVALTGGHAEPPSDDLEDWLLTRGNGREFQLTRVEHPRLKSGNLHGTGCTFATALAACHLLTGDYQQAMRRAVDFTSAAIKAGAGLPMGDGNGPLAHHLVNRQPCRGRRN